ncbi:MAG TPA: ABC transporter substrate-binding protein [Stellaceae bacterium]|jgi:branched-chain amino acid transport system substrate-binding protein|nr:ABC transporter substrate-binding protein [Stellaceae bacterium]
MTRTFALAAALAALLFALPAGAAGTVKIGALYPLTGSSAPAGQAAKAAVEVALDIINNPHPELKGLPLAATAGLPNLGGAKIEVINVDHQGDPAVGQQQTLRLITQDHVAALIGVYHSSVALTATAVAERYGVPFVVADSVAANITQRGFKWTFRVTPIATDFAKAYTDFLTEMKKSGKKINSVAVLNENTDYGTSVGNSIVAVMKAGGFDVLQIPYSAKSTDVSAQVLQLKEKKPDVAVFVGYTADEILYMKTLKDLDVMPAMIIGDDAGFSDPSFIPAVGTIAQGVLDRSAWAAGKPGSVTAEINAMYKAKTGRDLDDTSGRWMQAFFVLADAINRAGSTDPAKIQKALQETDMKPAQLMMGYSGVKFDATGQNILASTYLIQLQGKEYVSVWPDARATAKLQWPMKGWK